MKRTMLLTGLLASALSVSCGQHEGREPRTPKPMNADGSGPTHNGPGTPWQDPDPNEQPTGAIEQSDRRAGAVFIAAPGHAFRGSAELTEIREGVKIHIQITGAPPGKKGIHIHQTSDCSDIPNKSMGEHFMPEANPHGLPTAHRHHLGDLGNVIINDEGDGELNIVVKGANLRQEDAYSFVTRSVVLHESEDTGGGASGDAGTPIGCAPIQG
jgi:superoxide dismutase, Cu-Zn family